MTKLYQDAETRSPVDLKRAGQYTYAEHPLTEIKMVSWAIDEDKMDVWYPFFGEPIPKLLEEAYLDPSVDLVAHNASFERVLFTTSLMRKQYHRTDRTSFTPEIVKAIAPLKRWNCTAARAAYAGLPRTLEGAARAMKLPYQKDVEGHKLMLKLCKPRGVDLNGNYTWWEDPDDIRREGQYCMTDSEVERAIDYVLPELPAFERRVWELTEGMNDRGVEVDEALLGQMTMFVAQAENELNDRLRKTTCPFHASGDPRACENVSKCKAALCGAVPKVSNHQAIRKWVTAQGFPDIDADGAKIGIGKNVVNTILESDDLDDLVREVLTMRKEGGKSSTSKYKALVARLNRDRRVRGAMVYCGAASTKRWSSRGAQLQNMARGGTIETILEALADIMEGADQEFIRAMHGPPIVVASELVRPTFVAKKGFWMARGDYSQIEDRINNWYGGQEEQLEVFRKSDRKEGPDPYRVTASQVFNKPVDSITPIERQSGKVVRLAGGFQGGAQAILNMARIYNVKLSNERAEELKAAFREANHGICKNWYDADDAAIACMRGPIGQKHEFRPGLWFERGQKALVIRLPSGMRLVYWYPKLEKLKKPWGEKWSVTFWAEDSYTKQWTKQHGYGGLWIENIVQATSRCITADSLVKLGDLGYRPVLTVHDENVCEMSWDEFPEAEMAKMAVKAVMLDAPKWAAGIPIAVDASAGPRYAKA